MSNVDPTPPVTPRALASRVSEQDDTLTLDLSERQWGIGIFLFVWLVFWTFGCNIALKEV